MDYHWCLPIASSVTEDDCLDPHWFLRLCHVGGALTSFHERLDIYLARQGRLFLLPGSSHSVFLGRVIIGGRASLDSSGSSIDTHTLGEDTP